MNDQKFFADALKKFSDVNLSESFFRESKSPPVINAFIRMLRERE